MRDLFIAAFGAAIGFFGSFWLWWLDRRQQRHIARMLVATDLRLWIDRTLTQMYDMQNYESSDGNVGTRYIRLSDFPFEESLERVAKADHATALKIFKLIRQKNGANDEIFHENDVEGGEEAFDLWRVRCAQLWLKALKLYDRLSKQLEWSEKIASDQNRKMMKGEIDDINERKRKLEKSQAEILKELDVKTVN
jgi:hypothetical protein